MFAIREHIHPAPGERTLPPGFPRWARPFLQSSPWVGEPAGISQKRAWMAEKARPFLQSPGPDPGGGSAPAAGGGFVRRRLGAAVDTPASILGGARPNVSRPGPGSPDSQGHGPSDFVANAAFWLFGIPDVRNIAVASPQDGEQTRGHRPHKPCSYVESPTEGIAGHPTTAMNPGSQKPTGSFPRCRTRPPGR